MLTSLDEFPNVSPVDVAPLENHAPFERAVREGNGQFVFSSDNEVQFFADNISRSGFLLPAMYVTSC